MYAWRAKDNVSRKAQQNRSRVWLAMRGEFKEEGRKMRSNLNALPTGGPGITISLNWF